VIWLWKNPLAASRKGRVLEKHSAAVADHCGEPARTAEVDSAGESQGVPAPFPFGWFHHGLRAARWDRFHGCLCGFVAGVFA